MQFRQGDEVTLRGVVTHPDIGGKVYVEFEGVIGAIAVNAIGLTLVNRRYQIGDVVEARGGQPPGPHKVLGVHEGDLWTRDQSGAHVILVGNTVQPYLAPAYVQSPAPPSDGIPTDLDLVGRGWTIWRIGDPVPDLMNGGIADVLLADRKTHIDPHAPDFDWNADRSDNPIIAYIDDLPF